MILRVLSYLNPNNISYDLIKAIFIKETKDTVKKALDFLIRNGALNFHTLNDSYSIHESTQNNMKIIPGFYIEKFLQKTILAMNSFNQDETLKTTFNNQNLHLQSLF